MLTTIGMSAAGGLCLLVVLLLVVLAILPKKTPSAQWTLPTLPVQLPTHHEPVIERFRSLWEQETDEDLEVIADAYRVSRKADRAAVALERLSRITSAPTGSSKASKQQ